MAGHRLHRPKLRYANWAASLGLTFADPTAGREELAAKPFIDLLVSTRTELRQARQFSLADRIRDELAAQGVSLEDTAQGTLWRYQRPA